MRQPLPEEGARVGGRARVRAPDRRVVEADAIEPRQDLRRIGDLVIVPGEARVAPSRATWMYFTPSKSGRPSSGR